MNDELLSGMQAIAVILMFPLVLTWAGHCYGIDLLSILARGVGL